MSSSFTGAMTQVVEGPVRRQPSVLWRGTCAFLIAGWFVSQPTLAAEERVRYSIEAQRLAEALDQYGEQSGLQVVYDYAAISGLTSPSVVGTLKPEEALDLLLARTGITWQRLDALTMALRIPWAIAERGAGTGLTAAETPPAISKVIVEAPRILPDESSPSAFGFGKPLVKTPRSVSFISREIIDLHGLSAVEDLIRIAPGTFTTTRFGIQGSVDVRTVPADTYFRGMKRVNFQGHGRSVLAALDTIEIVRGPASPLFGMGKVGGYINVVPRSGREASDGYLKDPEGFAQVAVGSYQRSEIAGGFGGPLQLGERNGGYYLYGLVENSDTYAIDVPVSQKVGQAAVTLDNFVGPFRLEAGINYQLSGTAGALTNRVTQELIDTGRYVRGSPLAVLDANGNGKIGYLEMHRASPVAGLIGLRNQPLVQHFEWPRDAAGNPLPLDQFPAVPGIPQSMLDHLAAHPESDPTGLLRAQGPGGPVPISGYVPVGMVLDPRTVGYDRLDPRRADSFERELDAEFAAAYIDLVRDTDPDFTIRNQLFFDSMDQSKWSEQPGGGKQDVYIWEDKLTVTRRLDKLPRWLQLNTLWSANLRHVRATGRRYGGDFANHRTDVMLGDGRMSADSTFVHPFENADLLNDGAPWTSHYETRYSEAGLGLLLDVDLFGKTNLLVGGRADFSSARNTDFASFNVLTGTSGGPGAYTTGNLTAKASDDATSFSVSLSHEMPLGIHPYVTLATSSATLEGNNHKMDNDVIANGHVGQSRLREAGVKASLFDERLFITTSVYEQERTDVDNSDVRELLTADVTATRTRGWESEIKWAPYPGTLVSLYALNQRTYLEPNAGGNIMVDARTLGFQDVLDASGNVIYPAEAFLYGGRAFLVLPADLPEYRLKQGNPETQLGFSFHQQLPGGFGAAFSGNYFSATYSGQLKLVRLPAASVFNGSVFMERGGWRVKADVLNLFDERYFRARTGDTLGETLVQSMPGRRWQLTVNWSF